MSQIDIKALREEILNDPAKLIYERKSNTVTRKEAELIVRKLHDSSLGGAVKIGTLTATEAIDLLPDTLFEDIKGPAMKVKAFLNTGEVNLAENSGFRLALVAAGVAKATIDAMAAKASIPISRAEVLIWPPTLGPGHVETAMNFPQYYDVELSPQEE